MEVADGDVEAAEEERGFTALDGAEEYGAKDFGDGDLDGGAVFEVGEVDGGLAAGLREEAGAAASAFGVAMVVVAEGVVVVGGRTAL